VRDVPNDAHAERREGRAALGAIATVPSVQTVQIMALTEDVQLMYYLLLRNIRSLPRGRRALWTCWECGSSPKLNLSCLA
jgi:hypothetical protein